MEKQEEELDFAKIDEKKEVKKLTVKKSMLSRQEVADQRKKISEGVSQTDSVEKE